MRCLLTGFCASSARRYKSGTAIPECGRRFSIISMPFATVVLNCKYERHITLIIYKGLHGSSQILNKLLHEHGAVVDVPEENALFPEGNPHPQAFRRLPGPAGISLGWLKCVFTYMGCTF